MLRFRKFLSRAKMLRQITLGRHVRVISLGFLALQFFPPTRTIAHPIQTQSNNDFDSLSRSATVAREAGRPADAIPLYQRAIQLRPDWVEGWWYLGTLLYDTDQFRDAIPAFQKVAALAPQAPGHRKFSWPLRVRSRRLRFRTATSGKRSRLRVIARRSAARSRRLLPPRAAPESRRPIQSCPRHSLQRLCASYATLSSGLRFRSSAAPHPALAKRSRRLQRSADPKRRPALRTRLSRSRRADARFPTPRSSDRTPMFPIFIPHTLPLWKPLATMKMPCAQLKLEKNTQARHPPNPRSISISPLSTPTSRVASALGLSSQRARLHEARSRRILATSHATLLRRLATSMQCHT